MKELDQERTTCMYMIHVHAYVHACTVEPLYSSHPWGAKFWPLYIQGWPLLRGCFVHKVFIWDLGSWPLYKGGLYSGVAVKRGWQFFPTYMYFFPSFSFSQRIRIQLRKYSIAYLLPLVYGPMPAATKKSQVQQGCRLCITMFTFHQT